MSGVAGALEKAGFNPRLMLPNQNPWAPQAELEEMVEFLKSPERFTKLGSNTKP
jgi:hypothetical protein